MMYYSWQVSHIADVDKNASWIYEARIYKNTLKCIDKSLVVGY